MEPNRILSIEKKQFYSLPSLDSQGKMTPQGEMNGRKLTGGNGPANPAEIAEKIKKLKADNAAIKAENAAYKDLKQQNEELNQRIKKLEQELITTGEELKQIRQNAIKTSGIISTIMGSKTDKNLDPSNLEHDQQVKLASKCSKLNVLIKARIATYETSRHKNNIFGITENSLTKYVNRFNDFKNAIVGSKFLDSIIELNKEIIDNPNDFQIEKRDNEIRKFNAIMEELQETSDLLKKLLVQLHPEDPRLRPTGYFSSMPIFGKVVTSQRIYHIPGGDDFKVTANLVELPKEWEYLVSPAIVPLLKLEPQEHK